MTNRYFEPGPHRAARVNDLFAAVAPRYDLINDLQSLGLHRRWKRQLVQLALAGGPGGHRALDLCCGTGDVAFALARAGCDTTGLDFSDAMLAVAHSRFRSQSNGAKGPGKLSPSGDVPAGPAFLQGDAQSTPFPDNAFDVVTISYGLRNLSSWQRGLAEMFRVAKPGGRLLVLDFGKPDSPAWRAIYFAYLRWIVPVFGRLFCGDAQTHSYILESLQHYPAQHGVAAELERLGCTETRIVNLVGGMMTINLGTKPR